MAIGNPLHYKKCLVLGRGIYSTVIQKYCIYSTVETGIEANVLGEGDCVNLSNLCFSIFQSH